MHTNGSNAYEMHTKMERIWKILKAGILIPPGRTFTSTRKIGNLPCPHYQILNGLFLASPKNHV